MTECDIKNLHGPSKMILIALIIITIITGAVIGSLFTIWIKPSLRSTSITVSIDSKFAVGTKNGTDIIDPLNESYNCSFMVFISLQLSYDDFNSVENYMERNLNYSLNPDNITEITGNADHVSGVLEEVIGDSWYPFHENVDNESTIDGKTFLINIGNHVCLIPVFVVGSYYNETSFDHEFSFESVIAFFNRVENETATYEFFKNTKFIEGRGNTLVIKELWIDVNDWEESTLVVLYNGMNMELKIVDL